MGRGREIALLEMEEGQESRVVRLGFRTRDIEGEGRSMEMGF